MKKILLAILVVLACGAFMPFSSGNPFEPAPEIAVVDQVNWQAEELEAAIMEQDGYVCVSLDTESACDEWRYSYVDEDGDPMSSGAYAECFAENGDMCGRYCDASWPQSWCDLMD